MWRNHLLLDKGQSNGFQYAIRVRQHVGVPKPQNSPTLTTKISISAPVVVGPMLPAIEFHDQPSRAAGKIGDKGSDRTLSHKTDVQARAA